VKFAIVQDALHRPKEPKVTRTDVWRIG
jgi:hypothetical protein